RYETGLRYRDERRAAGALPAAAASSSMESPLQSNDEAASNFILMMLVSMTDPGLVILPTHRLVSSIPDVTGPQLAAALQPFFHVEQVGQGPEAARAAWELIEADGSQNVLGFGSVADGIWQLARFRDSELMAQRAAEHSPAWRGLAVAVLHVAV